MFCLQFAIVFTSRPTYCPQNSNHQDLLTLTFNLGYDYLTPINYVLYDYSTMAGCVSTLEFRKTCPVAFRTRVSALAPRFIHSIFLVFNGSSVSSKLYYLGRKKMHGTANKSLKF